MSSDKFRLLDDISLDVFRCVQMFLYLTYVQFRCDAFRDFRRRKMCSLLEYLDVFRFIKMFSRVFLCFEVLRCV